MKPMGNRVAVKLHEPETKTASGIIIPDTSVKRSEYGEVVYIGTENPYSLKPGDIILIDKAYGGFNTVIENGEKFLLVPGDAIMGLAEQ